MAIGIMEVATIARSQDYTAMKHNENVKTVVDQGNFSQTFSKEIEHKTKDVVKGDNADRQQKKFDAKEKGNGHYEGQQQKKENKKQFQEGIAAKQMGGFDMKV